MAFGRLSARARNQQKNSKERDQPNSVTKPSQKELSPVSRMQQRLGNQASSQLLQHISHTAPATTATEGLNLRQQQLTLMLALQAQQAGETMLWSQFENLSVGQRQTLLIQWYGEQGDLAAAMNTSPEWKQWQGMITATKQITLQRGEPHHEADITLLGASQPQYTMNSSALLVPYREAWLWLNYKGNKQGQVPVLQRLDRLSIPKKQLLLHKLNGAGDLSLYQLSHNITIEEHLKQWLDWKRIDEALYAVEQLQAEQAEELLEQLQQEQSVNQADAQPEQEGLEQEEEEDFAWLGMLGSDKQAAATNEPLTMEQMLQDHEKMFRLLFGIPFGDGKQPITVGNKAQLIDRFLEIDSKLQPKQQEQQRMQKLKEQGYSSLNQLYMLLKITIIELLYLYGVTRKDKKYIIILQKLELTQKGNKPTKDHIAAQVHKL